MEPELQAVSVDDEKVNLLLIEQMARDLGLEVTSFLHSRDAVAHLETHSVDLVFVDYMMPDIDGIGFIQRARARHPDIPIVMITGVTDDEELKLRALKAGATEFLGKPLNMAEFSARVRNLTQLRKSQLFYKDWAQLLQKEVDKATAKILEREHETLHVLGKAAEYKDPETANHISRMAHYTKILARAAGEREFQQDLIFKSSPLHDVGKLGIPESILGKPGKLDPWEFDVIKTHTTLGFEIIKDSTSPFLQTGSSIALTHHEKYDGTGYPKGIRGEEIPLFGRISAIADVFDALTSRRPYKEAWPLAEAYAYIESQKSKQFDPRLAELFLGNREDVERVYATYKDT